MFARIRNFLSLSRARRVVTYIHNSATDATRSIANPRLTVRTAPSFVSSLLSAAPPMAQTENAVMHTNDWIAATSGPPMIGGIDRGRNVATSPIATSQALGLMS